MSSKFGVIVDCLSSVKLLICKREFQAIFLMWNTEPFGVKKHFNITSVIIFDQSSSSDPTSSSRLSDSQVKSECLGK